MATLVYAKVVQRTHGNDLSLKGFDGPRAIVGGAHEPCLARLPPGSPTRRGQAHDTALLPGNLRRGVD